MGGSRQEESAVSRLFFGPTNIEALHQEIRYLVWTRSSERHVIGRQSDVDLRIIMRSIYLQYARNADTDVVQQVRQLNSLVLDYCVDRILAEVEAYTKYRQDVAQLPDPFSRGELATSKGTRSLELSRPGL